MLQFSHGEELDHYPRLRDTMFTDRATQFRKRLGWAVDVDGQGWERDDYDGLNPTYVIWQTPEGRHGGSMRFLPTLGRTMVNEHFSLARRRAAFRPSQGLGVHPLLPGREHAARDLGRADARRRASLASASAWPAPSASSTPAWSASTGCSAGNRRCSAPKGRGPTRSASAFGSFPRRCAARWPARPASRRGRPALVRPRLRRRQGRARSRLTRWHRRVRPYRVAPMSAPALTFSDDQAEAWDRVAALLGGAGIDLLEGTLTPMRPARRRFWR